MNPAQEILGIVREVIGDGPSALQQPRLTADDAERVRRNVARGLDTSIIDEFESELRRICNVEHAVAVSSGTAALHLSLLAAGVKPGDYVMVPSLTFAATANAVIACGARPYFVDSDPRSLGMDATSLDNELLAISSGSGGRSSIHSCIRATVPVHLLGNPCDLAILRKVADQWDLPIIEDAAQALGSALPQGDVRARTISFNLNKIVTTGGGGAVLTDYASVAYTVRHLARQARLPHPYGWQHDAVGFSYRMSPLGAALGVGQLRRLLSATLARKWTLMERYAVAFKDCRSAEFIGPRPGSNFWLNAIRMREEYSVLTEDVLKALSDSGFGARALFAPLHRMPIYAEFPRARSLAQAEALGDSVICLPSTIERRT